MCRPQVMSCWAAHPAVIRLGNEHAGGFQGKLEAGLSAVRTGLAKAPRLAAVADDT
jgi:hypothetical protein